MVTFKNTRKQVEEKVIVNLLSKVEHNTNFTQRSLATELGIAVGLMNQYLKRCITKGWIRASQISPRRITYFLTPTGLQEKSKMVKDYLTRSLTFFREAKAQCEEIFIECQKRNWTNIALIGSSDLADIAVLVAQGILQVEIADIDTNLNNYDAVLITDITDPQGTYETLKNKIEAKRILTLDLLHISKKVVA